MLTLVQQINRDYVVYLLDIFNEALPAPSLSLMSVFYFGNQTKHDVL